MGRALCTTMVALALVAGLAWTPRQAGAVDDSADGTLVEIIIASEQPGIAELYLPVVDDYMLFATLDLTQNNSMLINVQGESLQVYAVVRDPVSSEIVAAATGTVDGLERWPFVALDAQPVQDMLCCAPNCDREQAEVDRTKRAWESAKRRLKQAAERADWLDAEIGRLDAEWNRRLVLIRAAHQRLRRLYALLNRALDACRHGCWKIPIGLFDYMLDFQWQRHLRDDIAWEEAFIERQRARMAAIDNIRRALRSELQRIRTNMPRLEAQLNSAGEAYIKAVLALQNCWKRNQ